MKLQFTVCHKENTECEMNRRLRELSDNAFMIMPALFAFLICMKTANIHFSWCNEIKRNIFVPAPKNFFTK